MYSEVYTLFLFCQNPFSNMRQLLLCNRFDITEYFFLFLGKSCTARHPARTWAMCFRPSPAEAAVAFRHRGCPGASRGDGGGELAAPGAGGPRWQELFSSRVVFNLSLYFEAVYLEAL